MAILNSCCCWRSVRRGSFVVAIYSFVYYLVLVGTLWRSVEEDSDPNSIIINETERGKHRHFAVIGHLGMVMLALSLFGLLTCVLLIIGLCKDVRGLLVPWVVVALLVVCVDVVFVSYIVFQEHRTMNPAVAITLTVDFFLMVLHTYAILCVVSQYQEYLAGRGTSRHERGRSPPVIRYTRQSTQNSGVVGDSAKRTVTFLEHGAVTSNGLAPPTSAAAASATCTYNACRSPASAVLWEEETGEGERGGNNTKGGGEVGGGGRSSSSLHFPNTTRNGAGRHVQFSHSPVTETSLEESDNSMGLEHTTTTTTTKPPPPNSIAITTHTNTTTTTATSLNPSSPNPPTPCTEGHEAAPLIEPESPEIMKRF